MRNKRNHLPTSKLSSAIELKPVKVINGHTKYTQLAKRLISYILETLSFYEKVVHNTMRFFSAERRKIQRIEYNNYASLDVNSVKIKCFNYIGILR